MTFKNPTVTEPNTFEQTARGYWVILDADGVAIGVMHGRITTSFAKAISLNPTTGCFSITTAPSLPTTAELLRYASHLFKPIKKAEFGTAKAFGFGTEYDPEKLPNLVKLPDEISLDSP
jgi:hypothetical protein